MLGHYVDQMQQALAAEAAYRRTWQGTTKTPVEAGRREGRVGQQWRYTFRVRHAHRLRCGSTATLHTEGQQTQVLVHDLEGTRLTLMAEVDLGLSIAEGVVTSDTAFLASKARETLMHRWAHGPLNRSLAGLAVFGASAQVPVPPDPGWSVRVALDGLDEHQAEAVERSTRQPVVHLWGPAGTGKTQTLAAVTANYAAHGLQTLLSAHTNLALDEMLARALEHVEVQELAVRGEVVRLGRIRAPFLSERWGDVVGFEAIVARERAAHDAAMGEVGSELAALRRQLVAHPDDVEAKRRYAALSDAAARLERLHAAVPDRVLTRARILAATVTRVTLGQIYAPVDAVILDEASQVSAPLAFTVAGLARHSVLLAGDFRQLAPVVGTTDFKARRWLSQSVFESSGIAAAVARGVRPESLHVLRTQHRLPPAIDDVTSRLFYDGVLTSNSRLLGTAGIRCFDTTPFGFRTHIPRGGHSRVNPGQAGLVVALAGQLMAQGTGPATLISPYVAQAAALRQEARKAGLVGCEATTVHRVQGQSRGLVIYDLTDGAGAPPSRFTRASRLDEDGVRLACVALTRASQQLVVVGDFAHLLAVLPTDAFVRRLIEILMEVARPLPVPRGWEVPRSVG